jgi:hypothetical protein
MSQEKKFHYKAVVGKMYMDYGEVSTPKNKICWPEKFATTGFSDVSTDLVRCLKKLMVFETTDQIF